MGSPREFQLTWRGYFVYQWPKLTRPDIVALDRVKVRVSADLPSGIRRDLYRGDYEYSERMLVQEVLERFDRVLEAGSGQERRKLGMKTIPPLTSLVIMGGPSGAGKTTLANRLIAGKVPGFNFPLPPPAMRTDARSLHRKDIPRGSLVVEFATGPLAGTAERAACLGEINRLIDRAEQTLVLTYAISKADLVRQYAGRLSEEELRRTPELFRYLRPGKIRRLLGYALSREVERGYCGWAEIISVLKGRRGLRFLVVTSPFGENGRYEFSDPDGEGPDPPPTDGRPTLT